MIWTAVWNLRYRRRQIELAKSRKPLSDDQFIEMMNAEGVPSAIAKFMWTELQEHYFEPLTPYPSDRIFGDLQIDPDDLSEMAVEFEKAFGVRFVQNPIDCPPDPTICQLALAWERSSA